MDTMELLGKMDPPDPTLEKASFGPEFPHELDTVSRMWFACGYRPGITAYLNFFILRDFIVKHDTSYPPRFHSFKSMADSFYQTDLFIRGLTDSGLHATGGISSQGIRNMLSVIMARHQRFAIPLWMMTYFGFSLLENVEKQCAGFSGQEKQWHLQYMAKAYRIMGMPFSSDRRTMEAFARGVEVEHAAESPMLQKHARNILILGEMVGVPSAYESIANFLPTNTRQVFEKIYPRVKPSWARRAAARVLGKVLMKQAVGAPRKAVPV